MIFIHAFHDTLDQHGLVPETILADGTLHRCPTEGKPHKQNGAYIAYLDKPTTLWWCNWETDDQGRFYTEEKQTLSVAEMSAWREHQQSIQGNVKRNVPNAMPKQPNRPDRSGVQHERAMPTIPICASKALQLWKAYGRHGTVRCLFLHWNRKQSAKPTTHLS